MHDVTPVIQPFRLTTAPDQPVGLAAGTLDGAVTLPLVECLTLEHGPSKIVKGTSSSQTRWWRARVRDFSSPLSISTTRPLRARGSGAKIIRCMSPAWNKSHQCAALGCV